MVQIERLGLIDQILVPTASASGKRLGEPDGFHDGLLVVVVFKDVVTHRLSLHFDLWATLLALLRRLGVTFLGVLGTGLLQLHGRNESPKSFQKALFADPTAVERVAELFEFLFFVEEVPLGILAFWVAFDVDVGGVVLELPVL